MTMAGKTPVQEAQGTGSGSPSGGLEGRERWGSHEHGFLWILGVQLKISWKGRSSAINHSNICYQSLCQKLKLSSSHLILAMTASK